MLTDEQRAYLARRIQQLKSRMACDTYGPFRKAGMQQTLAGLRAQLRDNEWRPRP